MIESGENGEIVAVRLERLQDAGELIVPANTGGGPILHDGADREVGEQETQRRFARRRGHGGGRHHRIEQGKRNRRAHPAQKSSPGQALTLKKHRGHDLLVFPEMEGW